MNAPTPEDLQQLAAALATHEHRRHFFTRLENPLWLEPLFRAKFFAHPPAPQDDPDSGTVRFLDWPELDYISRMAPHAPKVVLQILQSLPDTRNSFILGGFLDAALALPPEETAALVPFLRRHVPLAGSAGLAERMGRVAGHLAETAPSAALELLQTLLTVKCRSKTDKHFGRLAEVVANIPAWEYMYVCERSLPSVIDAVGTEGVCWLVAELARAASCLHVKGSEPSYDGSTVWASDIDSNAERGLDEIPLALLAATRSQVIAAMKGGTLSEADAFRELLAYQPAVLTRLALFVAQVAASPLGLATVLGAGADRYLDGYHDQELFGLLAVRWGDVPPETRASFERQLLEAAATRGDSERPYAERRTLTMLDAAASSGPLSQDAEARRRELRALYPTTSRPENPRVTSWVGPTSPFELDELAEASVEALVERLQSWVPPPGAMEPSREGLSRVVKELVKLRAAEWSERAFEFGALRPIYVGAVLRGLEDAIREGRELDWSGVLPLAKAVLNRPIDPKPVEPAFPDDDPGWEWARTAVASLLGAGLSLDTSGLDPIWREHVWEAVCALYEDPDPTAGWEAEHVSDPLTGALNTTRGQAARAAVAYAMWVRRALEAAGECRHGEPGGIARMPEVLAFLERALDSQRERSVSVRAALAAALPRFVLLGSETVEQRREAWFPSSAGDEDLRLAAWEVYVAWNRLYESAARAVWPEYEAAVSRVGGNQRWEHLGAHDGSVDAALGTHLVALCFRGSSLDYATALDKFFAKADAEVRTRVLIFAGRLAAQADPRQQEAGLMRLQALFEDRLDACVAEGDPQELAAVAWWLGAPLSHRWLLQMLSRSLELGAEPPPALVADSLPQIAHADPVLVVPLVRTLLGQPEGRWVMLGQTAEIKEALRSAMKAEPAREDARKLINELGMKGVHGFRDLLDGDAEGHG